MQDGQPLPDFLYHYQRFNNEDRLRSILTEQKLYFSNPADFNDPWDGKAWFRTDNLHDPLARKAAVGFLAEMAKDIPVPVGKEEEYRRYRETLSEDLQTTIRAVEDTSKAVNDLIKERYRIYCLSACFHINLMWSHYANGHRGVCLKFSTANNLFASAKEITYQKRFPELVLGKEENVKAILLTKAAEWAYEREYRVVARDSEAGLPEGASMVMARRNRVELPQGTLVSIIAGCQASYGQISSLIDEVAPGLSLIQARQVPNRYQIEF